MGQLTVTFTGVCTHFTEAIPGVHRVVLPNASAFHFGLMRVPPPEGQPLTDEKVAYYVQPHYATLKTSSELPNQNPTVDNVITNGVIYAGCQLEVPNATGPLTYEPTFNRDVKPLQHFVPEFKYSNDVVLNKRAACYFDVKNGVLSAVPANGGAINVVITIPTDGLPGLQLTPFETEQTVDISKFLVIDDNGNAEVTVANIEFDPDPADEDVSFDYVLHYLTAERGIPPALSARTPGMDKMVPLTPIKIGNALNGLATLIENGGPTAEQVMNFDPDIVDPSCSDSRYP